MNAMPSNVCTVCRIGMRAEKTPRYHPCRAAHYTRGPYNRDMHLDLTRLLIALAAALPLGALAQTLRSDEHSFRLVKVVEGLEQPWSVAFLPDGRMLVTERRGACASFLRESCFQTHRRSTPGHGTRAGRPARCRAASRFQNNQLVYLAYAARGSDGVGTELARGRLAGQRLEDVQVLSGRVPRRGGPAFRRAHRVRPPGLSVTLARRPRRARARAAPRRPRRFGDPAARRRARAEGQSLRRPKRVEGGEVHAREPQHPGRRAASADRAPVGCEHGPRAATRST